MKLNASQVVVGIDCAQEKHEYQISTRDRVLSRGSILNTKKVAERFVKKMVSIAEKDKIVIGMEATGTYHICLQKYFISRGYRVVVINPLKTSAFNKIDDYGNKTDAIDANGICQFLLDGKHKKIKQMNQKYLTLRELCRCRLMLQSDKTRVASRLHSRLSIINPEFRKYFYDPFCASGLFILENYTTPEQLEVVDIEMLQKELDKVSHGLLKKEVVEKIVHLAKDTFAVKVDIEGYIRYIHYLLEQYKFLTDKVNEIKKEIRKEAKKEYCKKEIEIVSSMKGISTELAAGILSELGDINNFEKISSIVRFAGLISLQKQSGKRTGRSKMSKQGSKYLRCYLHQAMMGAKLHSPTFAAVYANKCLKIKDLDQQSKTIAKAGIRSNLVRRILEITATNLMKNRLFDEKIAFEAIDIDDFVRETIRTQFNKILNENIPA